MFNQLNQITTMKTIKRFLLTAVLLVLTLTAAAATQRGDTNRDGVVNMDDLSFLINFLLTNTVDACDNPCDVNMDGQANMDDLSEMINFMLTNQWSNEPLVATEVITVNGVSFTMVYVKAGKFTMGATDEQLDDAQPDEYPAHEVTLTFDYYIAQTEVTRELWNAVMGEKHGMVNGDLQCPITNVTRFECALFADYLTHLTGRVFRMPTEAEWEYAARGGKFTKGYKFAGSNDVSEVAWYTDGPGAGLHPVALKTANELGLYDMSGNAAEWCQDWFVPYYSEPEINPIGPESGQFNVYRGGSWTQPANECRVASRFSLDPHKSNEGLGLRIVMNP